MSSLAYQRQRKDAEFRQYPFPHGPLLPAQLDDFDGLKYFPENPALRLHLKLDKYPTPEIVTMQTSRGDLTQFEKYGRIRFSVDGQTAELQIYRGIEGGELFLPFKDSTTGIETYGAGRYLEPEDNFDGTIEVDFNLAYNPFCAYNEQWNCPIPPKENHLSIRIEAGEKNFHAASQ